MLREILLCLFCLCRGSYAQDDPQDIADIACAYSGARYEFITETGTIESPGYPGYYDNYEYCQWYINPTNGIPDGMNLFLEIVTFNTEDGWDELWVYEGEGIYGDLLFFLDGRYTAGSFFSMGDEPVTLYFSSDSSNVRTGFQVTYYFGEGSPAQELAEIACDESTKPALVTNVNTTIIETINYPASHPSSTFCEWVITPDNAPDGIYLNVIYYYAYNSLYIYFDDNSNGAYDEYLYGSYSNGYNIYVPGSVMTLKYDGYSSYTGFQMVYYPADPACTSGSASVIQIEGKGEIQSPGYPYDVPEHVSCRWLLEVADNQKIILNVLDQDLYGDGIDCTDEYVEILDGDTVDALSLGKFCGNISFGTIPSTGSSLQVYFRTHEESDNPLESHTGFVFNYEPIDVI